MSLHTYQLLCMYTYTNVIMSSTPFAFLVKRRAVSGVASTGNVRITLRNGSLLRLNLCVRFKAFALSPPGFILNRSCAMKLSSKLKDRVPFSCCFLTEGEMRRRRDWKESKLESLGDLGSNPFHTFTLWRRVVGLTVGSGKGEAVVMNTLVVPFQMWVLPSKLSRKKIATTLLPQRNAVSVKWVSYWRKPILMGTFFLCCSIWIGIDKTSVKSFLFKIITYLSYLSKHAWCTRWPAWLPCHFF